MLVDATVHSFARGRNRTRSGVCLVDKDTRVAHPHFLLDGDPSQAAAQVAIWNTGAARMGCRLLHSDSATLALHPCQKSAASSHTPGHWTLSLLAALLRFLRPRPVLLRHAMQLLFETPRRTPRGRPKNPVLVIRRDTSSGGLLAPSSPSSEGHTSFRGLIDTSSTFPLFSDCPFARCVFATSAYLFSNTIL